MLTGCLRTNPWSLRSVNEAMDAAMSMHASERFERFTKDYSYTVNLKLTAWFEDFVDELFFEESLELVRGGGPGEAQVIDEKTGIR